MNSVDLSGLDGFNPADFLAETDLEAGSSGKPLLIPLDKILPDPDQPRQEINQERLAELAASIRERGVKSPISVKPANEAGIYYINHGERRYWGSLKAEKTEIPAFIDDDHNGYDQAIENIQREDLTPLEIAHFIERRLESGDKKGQIAKMLGKPASYVSDHAVFFQLPDCVRELYDSSRNRDIQALAALHRTAKIFPDDVESFCRGDRKISQAEVKTFIADLKEQKTLPAKVEDQGLAAAGAEGKEPSVSALTADTSSPVAGSALVENLSSADSPGKPGEDLETALYEQLERLLGPLENYLKKVTDPDFRAVAAKRLQEIAGRVKI